MSQAAEPDLFARDNLVAWCVVPFDAAKRGPEARAQMLDDLGIRQLAYDWRGEHIPQFDEEVETLKKHGIKLAAWWISPADLNETNLKILDVIRRHRLRLQLWVLIGDPQGATQEEKVKASADAIRPLALAARELGCQVGLYNHGGWFGEPENQLQVLDALQLDNVGLVYNLHHGHAHLDRFPALLEKMKPHLLTLNLNGMKPTGDQQGEKILPLGSGELDLGLLKAIRDSGYRGPIGILNHTDLDAKARLADNLAGLDWLLPQLDGKPAGPPPKMRTFDFKPPATAAPNAQGDYDPRRAAQLIADAQQHGDAARGAAVFSSAKFACISCHRVGKQGGAIGPELTKVGSCLTPDEIAEALLWPKRTVKPAFVATAIATADGLLRQGYIVKETPQEVVLREATANQEISLPVDEIVERQPVGTLMPDGLMAAMTPAQRRDVMQFLLSLGRHGADHVVELLEHAHEAQTFAFNSAPLIPSHWNHAGQHVNRDRVYDFYAKEADHFRTAGHASGILPEFPGLDGGQQGHWGNQNEDYWRNDDWNATRLGSVMSGIFFGEGGLAVGRAVCVRFGPNLSYSGCFDPETCSYAALWRDGYVKFSSTRHGFVDGLRSTGIAVPAVQPALPEGPRLYRGFYRHGDQVAFAYRIGDRDYLDVPTLVDGKFVRNIAPLDEHPLRELAGGGPPQWPQRLETRGKLGANRPYAIDTIELPWDNPWRALMFVGGHDFFPDGSAMVCTMQGDVWHVTGLDVQLEHVRWRRFASGLHHALGLVIADNNVYVLGRDQITRLHDLNQDGEADFYERFSGAYTTSTAGHDFICGLERDHQGRFYTASGNQGLLRISPDGKDLEVLAVGFRNPDGLGLLPDGSIAVPSSEGEWTATSMINLVPGNRPVGAAPLAYGYGGPRDGKPPELPLVYLPRGIDNSSGGNVSISSDRWGPLEGGVIHLSFGAGTHFLVLRDQVGNQIQGAVAPLPGDFLSGVHRGKFSPHDGQLYVSGMGGWGTYTPANGSFERVRYTGDRVQVPSGFHVHENGVRVSFTSPLDSSVAGDAANQFAQVWNYRYSSAYGSPEFAPSHPGMVGHDRLPITRVHLLPDNRSLFLEMPDLQPVNQLHLRLRVNAGEATDLFATVHAMDAPFTDLPDYRAEEKTVAAHPLLADLALLAQPPIPNPWREPLADAQPLTVEAGKNLTFAAKTLAVRPGQTVKLTFVNPDVVPHNWVLLKPGTLAVVGNQVNRLIADPAAASRQYVPETPDVLAYTDIVPGGKDFTIYFRAPETPGRYPYLCSFPGHWMVMNGQLIVE